MRIKGSRINFGTHSIYKHPQGIYIDGKFRARQLTGQSHFQGETRGYVSGRFESSIFNDSIETFPFASDVGSEEYGNLSVVREYVAGQSSATHGYTSGGFTITPAFARYDIIDKFPFSGVTGSASDVGNLTQVRQGPAGQSSTVNGYTSGGVTSPPSFVNTIDKFPFSSDVDATETGTLDQTRGYAAGQSSSTHGYTSGGQIPSVVDTIDKFPFASNTAASDVEDLTQARTTAAGQSSAESGYTSGGATPSVWVTTIDKFSFASDAAATEVGVLTQLRGGAGGQSSTTHGYTSGGRGPGSLNTIDKFPFSADIDATDVGNLEDSKDNLTGQQV